MRAHAGHAHMLRSAGERQVPQPDDAMLRGAAPAAGQRHSGRGQQQGGPDHAGCRVQRPATGEWTRTTNDNIVSAVSFDGRQGGPTLSYNARVRVFFKSFVDCLFY